MKISSLLLLCISISFGINFISCKSSGGETPEITSPALECPNPTPVFVQADTFYMHGWQFIETEFCKASNWLYVNNDVDTTMNIENNDTTIELNITYHFKYISEGSDHHNHRIHSLYPLPGWCDSPNKKMEVVIKSEWHDYPGPGPYIYTHERKRTYNNCPTFMGKPEETGSE